MSISPSAAANSQPAEFLTFKLANEEYGIGVMQIQEIRSYEEPTSLANAPAHVKGLLNLRGTIVPIIDLREQFGIGEAVYDDQTAVVITCDQNKPVGLVVDRVVDVVALNAAEVRPLPDGLGGRVTEHLIGLGTPADDRTLILMDTSRLLA